MRASVSWLAEYVEGLHELSSDQIDAALVRMGLEVEAVHDLGAAVIGPVVVGEVVQITELTEFKKPIRYCRVDVGEHNVDGGPREIVCGARNFAQGDWVVVALPGSVLPGDFAIATRKTYGHISDGMICAADELGIGSDHSGIIVLPRGELSADVRPGVDARAVLGLDDTVFELAITPDRGYCLSIRGIARELSHALGSRFSDPAAVVAPKATDDAPYPVRVLDEQGCDRFVARVIRGVDASARTPLWMRQRLALAGVRSISLIVDVTNYVMLELGQPMHAWDADRLVGELVVRRAHVGEQLTTLDDVARVLDPEDLVIADDTGVVSLAAVMGGASTEVSASTTSVLLEAAHWDPVSVARTARRHKLPSEAAKRYERGVDPQLAPVAAERAVALLTELAGGELDPRVSDLNDTPPRPTIPLPVERPAQIAGVAYSGESVVARLVEIGCEVSPSGDGLLQVTPPSWRTDLTDPADLVEEVIRLAGYDAIPSILPPAPASSGLTMEQRRRRAVSRALAEAGFVEVLSYPFVSPRVHDQFGLADDDPRRSALRLANPLSDEEPELRTSLLPGLLRALTRNVGRGQRDLALFEVGLVYHAGGELPAAPRLAVDRRPSEEEIAELHAAVPQQPCHIAVAMAGERERTGWWGKGRAAAWSDAIQAARLIGEAAGVSLTPVSATRNPWHPGRCAALTLADGTVVGYAGELHPSVVAEVELPPRTVAVELDLSALPASLLAVAPAISSFPPALLDVAVVVPSDVPTAEVAAALEAGAGELLESLRLFDVYIGEQVGAGRKSLAYRLSFRSFERTLTAEETTAARDAAVAEADRRFGASLRG